MFNPRCQLLITSKCFPADKFICLGSQLISIVNLLEDVLPMHIWYGADVEAEGKEARELDVNGVQLNPIGTDQQLVQYCSKITQFIWGVFLCVDRNYPSPNFRDIELETEDKSFRPIPLDGIQVEIRAFDTSYFAIYSEDEKIIKALKKKLKFSELSVKLS